MAMEQRIELSSRLNETGRRAQGRTFSRCLSMFCAAFVMCCQVAVAQLNNRATPAAEMRDAVAEDVSQVGRERYRIGPGDVLEIRVLNRPQLSRDSIRVETDGMIGMPLIEGELRAACQTESDLAREIARRYLRYLKNPQVYVFIKEYNSKQVAVIGAVNTPGRFLLQRQVRLLELLALAGGPGELAGRNIQVVHNAPDTTCDSQFAPSAALETEFVEVSSYKLRETLTGVPEANPFVRPGDVITISEAEQVYVIGNVVKPAAISLKEKITVSQAIAMAGGTLPDTRSERVRIVRQDGANGGKTEIFVDLKALGKRQAEDVVLQPNDIVEVPTAGGKRMLRTLLGGVVPSLSRLPVQIIR